jgi:hypothetical protein
MAGITEAQPRLALLDLVSPMAGFTQAKPLLALLELNLCYALSLLREFRVERALPHVGLVSVKEGFS